jgi:hypothetical protein
MYNEHFDQFAKLSKHISTPINEWNKAATDILQKVTQQNIELVSENFSRLSDQMKRFSHVKRPEDLITLQKDCVNEDISAAIENTQKIVHMSMENMEEITKLCGTVRESVLTPTGSSADKRDKERDRHGK